MSLNPAHIYFLQLLPFLLSGFVTSTGNLPKVKNCIDCNIQYTSATYQDHFETWRWTMKGIVM